MTFNQAVSNAMPIWFADGFTEAIIYNGVTIRGHVDYGGETGASVEVQISDVPAPKYRDKVIVAGVTWYVFRETPSNTQESELAGDTKTWRILLYKDERPTF